LNVSRKMQAIVRSKLVQNGMNPDCFGQKLPKGFKKRYVKIASDRTPKNPLTLFAAELTAEEKEAAWELFINRDKR